MTNVSRLQTKIIIMTSAKEMQQAINEFTINIPLPDIVDIKFTASGTYVAMIMYITTVEVK